MPVVFICVDLSGIADYIGRCFSIRCAHKEKPFPSRQKQINLLFCVLWTHGESNPALIHAMDV